MSGEILFLNPVFKQMIWGGDRLGKDWPYKIPGDNTGECWAVSAHPNGDCTIKKGTYEGRTLSQLWKENPELFGNTNKDRFPLLVKIIDAKDDLSIQVHPDDTYAMANENGSLGKTECWYVLDSKEGASLVVGHNAATKAELNAMVKEGRWNELLREIPVKKGDFIQIEPGTVHAIKGGLMILETQQNSDITYRVYDYNRLTNGKPRELHLEKSLDVITVPAKSVEESILEADKLPENKLNLLVECGYYKVWKLDITNKFEMRQEEDFLIMSVIGGEGELNGETVRKGDHFILPYGYGDICIKGELQLIISTFAHG
ncbi:MAG: mannose-6-phosphate isomerase, class I [Butyrivibrio sp.]|nr:mannose-6-phosphate isomerase, class I [Butyrivibrio sp.]